MRVSLFVPCLVDQCEPRIAEATARVLSRAGLGVDYPRGQTCCGQPLYKLGHWDEARQAAERFLELFAEAEAVVAPSGSCVTMVRHYPQLFAGRSDWEQLARDVAGKTFELSQFLVDKLDALDLDARFPGRAVYHDSCQVGRALGIVDQPRRLLRAVQGLELAKLQRPEACCGFGGAFSLTFPAVGDAILDEKIDDILAANADFVITAEPSCLLNIRGRLEAMGKALPVYHLAEILERT